MPTACRPARSLLALALVVNLLVAAVPDAALAGRPVEAVQAVVATERSAVPGPSLNIRDARRTATTTVASAFIDRDGEDVRRRPTIRQRTELVSRAADWISRPAPNLPKPKVRAEPKVGPGSSRSSVSASSLQGRNHVWIPALGVDRSVSFFACTSNAYPGDRVYRWGCAGGNNVYLFGHAYSVFRPLHDAYVRGRLAKGMKVYYADDNGRVSTYAVSWWKVTAPDKGEWAYAAQSRPSLTLQTCVGARSQYRLIVRLAKVG